MPQVLVTVKVMPKEAGVDMDKLEADVKSAVSPDRITREPIAFGIVALKVSKLVDDSEGQVEALENGIKAIDAVGEIEVVEITRTI